MNDREGDDGVVRVTGKELGEGLDLKQLRKAAKKYAKEHIAGKIVTIKSAGVNVLISQKGLDHSIWISRNEDVLHAMTALPELLRRSIKVREEGDKRGRDYVKAMEIYQAPVDVGGRRYVAEIFVIAAKSEARMLDNIRVFYHQKLKGSPRSGR